MPYSEVELHIPFAGGVETKTDPKAVPPVKLLGLENGVFTRAISIRKRNGYEERCVVADARRTGARGDELVVFTGDRCHSLQTETSEPIDVGAVFSAVGADRPLVRTGTQQTMPDHATIDGVTVSAWEDSNGGVWWSVSDEVSGRVFRPATQADAAGISPRCVSAGSNLHVYYAVPGTHSIMAIVVVPSDPTAVVSPIVLVDDIDSTNTIYDACQTARAGTPAAIVWCEHATTNLRIGYVEGSGVIGGPSTGHPSILIYAASRLATTSLGLAFLDVDGANSDLFGIGYVTGAGNCSSQVFTGGSTSLPISLALTSSSRSAVSVQRIAMAWTPDSVLYAAWEEAAVAASNRFVVITDFDFPAASGSLLSTIRSVGLASRAFTVDDSVFAVFVHDTTYFNTYVTLRLTDFVAPGRHAPASAGSAPARRHLPSAHVVGSVVAIALPFRQRLEAENNDQFRETGIRLFTMDFADDDSHQTAQLGRGLYLAGACPQHYDGRIWSEAGFHFGPELIVTTPAVGGFMESSTTYKYVAWYEATDAQGEVHLGPVSIGSLVTMGASDTQVTLTLPTLRVTQKANVRICVSRSLAALTGNTAQLFRVTSLDPTTDGDVNGYVANDTSVDTVTFIDRMSDADLILQEQPYITGGVLSNDPVPLGAIIAGGKGRLFATDPSDGNTIRYSKPIAESYGVEFAPELALSVDPFGGDITAIATRDDRVFVFKANAIFTFVGDGPTDTGDASVSGFSAPQLLPGDVGCEDPSSIVLVPQGLLFKSAKGIYLVGNDGGLQYIGAPVEAYNAQVVRRALVMPDRTQALFLTNDGLSLLYDYLFDQWSTFTNHEGLDAVIVENTYHYLRNDGAVWRETIDQFSDAGTRVRMRFETAWLHMLPQLSGFQKFWHMHLIGTWISPHQLGIQYQTDYSPQWTGPVWYDATGLDVSTGWITGTAAIPIGTEPITGSEYGDGEYGDGEYGGTMPGLYQWHLDLHEKGHSIRFRIEDFEASGYTGACFELTELLLTGWVLGHGPRQLTPGRSF